MMLDKNWFGYLAVFLNILSSAPYIWTMLKGRTRPHIFTWVIWTLSNAITAVAQYSAGAGPGAWPTMLGFAISLLVVILSFLQKADWSITRSDRIALTGALLIIPLWYLAQSALIAAIMATIIDTVAYYPTFRKSYRKPHQEMIFLYLFSNFQHVASICAMERYSVTTLVMPVTMLFINVALILMLLRRRQVITH